MSDDRVCVRLTGQSTVLLRELMKSFPDDYPTPSSVVRSGIRAVHRWKHTKEGEQE